MAWVGTRSLRLGPGVGAEYRFDLPGLGAFAGILPVDDEKPPTVRVGDQLVVVYLPGRPRQNRAYSTFDFAISITV